MFGLCCCPEEAEGLCEQGPDPENAHWLLDLSGVAFNAIFSGPGDPCFTSGGVPSLTCANMNTVVTRTLNLFFASPLGTGGTEYAYRGTGLGDSNWVLHVFPPGEGPLSATILGPIPGCSSPDKVPERLTCYLRALGESSTTIEDTMIFFVNTDGEWDTCRDGFCCTWNPSGVLSLTRVDP